MCEICSLVWKHSQFDIRPSTVIKGQNVRVSRPMPESRQPCLYVVTNLLQTTTAVFTSLYLIINTNWQWKKSIEVFYYSMVATGQEKVREKTNFLRSGKSQGILILFREKGNFEKSQGKVTLVREKWEFINTVFVEDQYPFIKLKQRPCIATHIRHWQNTLFVDLGPLFCQFTLTYYTSLHMLINLCFHYYFVKTNLKTTVFST